ncbi:MAG TPA: acyl carrier protein [Clostridiales bacterium]|jgi:acyl carrier protein|nr:acyl carrier protein [Clostridiales bacterium]
MVKEKVIAILAEYKDCDAEDIDAAQSFEELKLDSLDTVEIVMNLEEAFDIELKITEDLKTVQDVIDAIEKLV